MEIFDTKLKCSISFFRWFCSGPYFGDICKCVFPKQNTWTSKSRPFWRRRYHEITSGNLGWFSVSTPCDPIAPWSSWQKIRVLNRRCREALNLKSASLHLSGSGIWMSTPRVFLSRKNDLQDMKENQLKCKALDQRRQGAQAKDAKVKHQRLGRKVSMHVKWIFKKTDSVTNQLLICLVW